MVLVDNRAKVGLKSAWGLSIVIKLKNTTVLFDAGPNPAILKWNAKALGFNLSEIDFAVVSHEHWDHIGGLKALAEVKPGCVVYVPSGMSWGAKNEILKMGLKVVEVDKTLKVADNVFIIGQLYGPPYEQALAVKVDDGLWLFVGCSHPGVDNFVAKAVEDLKLKVKLVIGGFHLAGESKSFVKEIVDNMVSLGVEKICPLHCSGSVIRNLLVEEYNSYYLDGYAGLILSIPSQ
ncbi:MAG: MBL fold metallo-hydrolase [Candidatus Methanomethylicota archaeon]|nr:MAG: MBL fold metallo-hydrolase [Candidatus Verstraetearchaeota archaeon]